MTSPAKGMVLVSTKDGLGWDWLRFHLSPPKGTLVVLDEHALDSGNLGRESGVTESAQ